MPGGTYLFSEAISIFSLKIQILPLNKFVSKEICTMCATGIVRRIDDLFRTDRLIRQRLHAADPSQITLTHGHGFIMAIKEIAEKLHITA